MLDSSAILAVALREPGADAVVRIAASALMSSANLAEVLLVASRKGLDSEAICHDVLGLGLDIVPVTIGHARIAAQIWRAHPTLNLSLGDKLCLALAFDKNAEIMTSDREMTRVGMDLTITLFR
ncbi:MAG: PIN domain-containing protein [Rhizomicrobium sp.]